MGDLSWHVTVGVEATVDTEGFHSGGGDGGDQERLDSSPDDASPSVLAVAIADHLACLVAVLLKACLLVHLAYHMRRAALVTTNWFSQRTKCGMCDLSG